jgi:hypothetical protein
MSDTPQFGFPIEQWHWWFAWFPVTTYDGRLVWLRRVMRRKIQKHNHLDGGPCDWWQYKYLRGYITLISDF